MRKLSLKLLMICALIIPASLFAQSAMVPSGTEITVRADQAIKADVNNSGRMFPATVSTNVLDQNGNIVIPKGSRAQLQVAKTGTDEVSLGLRSVTVNGRRYMLETSNISKTQKSGLGKNKRTGEYVGGGALAGTLLGAIAGGAKGAVIGAVAGGAAGAGAQVFTRGKNVDIPAETQLNFKLQQDVAMRETTGSRRPILPASDQPH